MTKVYTAEEVSKHNNEKDLWMVIHGKVYDLTKFLKEHPGGEEVLITSAGQDGSKCFDEIGHSQEALQLRDTFEIGEATGTFGNQSADAADVVADPISDDDWHYEPPKYETTPWMPVIIAAGVLIYALIFYYLWY